MAAHNHRVGCCRRPPMEARICPFRDPQDRPPGPVRFWPRSGSQQGGGFGSCLVRGAVGLLIEATNGGWDRAGLCRNARLVQAAADGGEAEADSSRGDQRVWDGRFPRLGKYLQQHWICLGSGLSRPEGRGDFPQCLCLFSRAAICRAGNVCPTEWPAFPPGSGAAWRCSVAAGADRPAGISRPLLQFSYFGCQGAAGQGQSPEAP